MNRAGPGLAIGAALLLAVAGLALAHDGEVHDEIAAAAPAGSPLAIAALRRPQRLADGSLNVDKPMQRLLQLRTTPWSAAGPAGLQTLVAEAQPQPEFALDVVAPERGRLEAPESGWPQAGQRVAAGTVLAWLRPQLSQQEIAERRAKIATIEQQLVITDTNVERQEMQSAANIAAGGTTATDNIWFEKYVAERDAMRGNRALLQQTLGDRLPLRATVSGRLLSVAYAPGSVVEPGQRLLRIADPAAMQLTAFHQQAGLAARIASAELADGRPLQLRGVDEPLADGSGWRLRFDLPTAGSLSPGQIASIRIRLKPLPGQVALPPGACVRSDEGALIWIHREAERYEPRKLVSCNADRLSAEALSLVEGDRLVTAGAALLSQYR